MATYDLRPVRKDRPVGHEDRMWPWVLLAFTLLVALGLSVSVLAGWLAVGLP